MLFYSSLFAPRSSFLGSFFFLARAIRLYVFIFIKATEVDVSFTCYDLYFFLNRASAVLFNTVVKLSSFFKRSISLRQLLASTAAAQPKESVESEDNLVKFEKNIR